MRRTNWTLLLVVLCTSTAAQADNISATGLPVPQLAGFDEVVLQYMADEDIRGCTVGVMKDGCVVYQRGFGSRDFLGAPMPENATMRLASVTKVLTKRAIYQLAEDDLLTVETNEGLTDVVFDVGQAGGGILTGLDPWPFLQDYRVGNITVQDLVSNKGGWTEDYSWKPIFIYNTMELDHAPPNIEEITRYALGQMLGPDPGETYKYSNFGYDVLRLVVEARSGQSFYAYLRQHVLTENMWVPSTDLFEGLPFLRTGLREPFYLRFPGESTVHNVYDPEGPLVSAPYGGINMEAMLGAASMAASAAPMLTLANLYPGSEWSGSMSGSSTRLMDSVYEENVHIVVMCNDRLVDEPVCPTPLPSECVDPERPCKPSCKRAAGRELALAIDAVIEAGVNWPTRCIDGQWVDCTVGPPSGIGSYDDPYDNFTWALSNTTNGTKLMFHPGNHAWTGVLDKKLLMDAPVGAARIGVSNCD